MRPRVAIVALLAVLGATQAARGQTTDLLVNGNFEGGVTLPTQSHFLDAYPGDRIPKGWSPVETFPASGIEYSAYLPAAKAGGGRELRFIRREYWALSSGDITGVYQSLASAPRAAACSSLALKLEVKVKEHDLVGGGHGTPSWEWPVFVQIDYLTPSAQPQVWRHGWYATYRGDGTRVTDTGSGLISEYKDDGIVADRYGTYQFDLLRELPQLDRLQRITVGGAGWSFDSAVDNVSILCQPSLARLLSGRFEVSMEYRVNPSSPFQRAAAMPVSDKATLFWFFSQDNPEMMVKVLDSCSTTGSFWVFVGGLTNVETRVLVKDRASATEKAFPHSYGSLMRTVLDDQTFDDCHLAWP